jgi:hypothetical protein
MLPLASQYLMPAWHVTATAATPIIIDSLFISLRYFYRWAMLVFEIDFVTRIASRVV